LASIIVKGAPIHVLLVEEDLLDVNTVRLVLEGLGFDHDLTVLQNARQAIAFLNRDEPYESAVHPDLILVGLRASDADGAAVLREIARLRTSGSRTITVMVLVKGDDPQSQKAAKVLGADTYCIKPTRSEEVLALASKFRQMWAGLRGRSMGFTGHRSRGSESST
jgi:CheY-like chemotaxis protein